MIDQLASHDGSALMPDVSIRYWMHFAVFFAFAAMMLAAGVYLWGVSDVSYARLVGKPIWFIALTHGGAFLYVLYMTVVTSFSLRLHAGELIVKRPWGHIKTYNLKELTGIVRVTRRLSIIRTTQGKHILLSGLSREGRANKLEIERQIQLQLALK